MFHSFTHTGTLKLDSISARLRTEGTRVPGVVRVVDPPRWGSQGIPHPHLIEVEFVNLIETDFFEENCMIVDLLEEKVFVSITHIRGEQEA